MITAPRPKLLPTLLLTALAHLPARDVAGQQHAAYALPDGGAPVPGQVVLALPSEATRLAVDGQPVYYRDGVFFRFAPAGWVVVRAPLGVTVPSLPRAAVRVSNGDRTYWYDRGAFYTAVGDGGFTTVLAPLGCVVPALPTDVATIADIDGVLYYLYAGAFYRPLLQDGRTVYLVTDP